MNEERILSPLDDNQPATKGDVEKLAQTVFKTVALKEDLEREIRNVRNDIATKLVTKDEFREGMQKLREELPSKKDIEKSLLNDDVIIRKLTKIESENAAHRNAHDRIDEKFRLHDRQFDRLEKHLHFEPLEAEGL